MSYLKYNTEDGQTIRKMLCLAEVVIFSVMADKLNLQIEMSSLDMCNIFSTVILFSHSFLQFVAFRCRSALIVASDWFVLPV